MGGPEDEEQRLPPRIDDFEVEDEREAGNLDSLPAFLQRPVLLRSGGSSTTARHPPSPKTRLPSAMWSTAANREKYCGCNLMMASLAGIACDALRQVG